MSNSKTKVTEVEFVPVKPKDGLVGFASFVIDGKLYVGSVAVFTKLNGEGYRLAYPTKKINNKDLNIVHPISKEVGNTIEQAVTEKINGIISS